MDKMDTVKVMQVIETTIARRGEGIKDSPVRIVTQYWTMEGKMIFEIDPCMICVRPENTEIYKKLERTIPLE